MIAVALLNRSRQSAVPGLLAFALFFASAAASQTGAGKEATALRDQAARLLASGDAREAATVYTRALDLGLRHSSVFVGRATAWSKLEEWSKAIDDYSAAIRLRLDLPEPYKERGDAYAKVGRFEDAIDDYNQAILIKRDYWEAYVARAGANGSSGRWERVLADLDLVLGQNPKHARAL